MAGNILSEWGSSAAYTITLASLATSATKVFGRESTAVSATTADAEDYMVAGFITTGTSPTVGTAIDVYVYGSVDDTTYPGDTVLDGTDSDETWPSENVRNSAVAAWNSAVVDATTDRKYYFRAYGIAHLFGGKLPKNHGLFVTHNTGVNLNATGGNHVMSYTTVWSRYT